MVKEPSQRYNPNGSGFIILHRKILSSAIFRNPNDLKIWVWVLLRANHSASNFFWNGEEISINRGQFIYGIFTSSEELSMNPSTVYKILKKLEKAGMISIKSNNKNSLLSVINYECYQNNDIQKEKPSKNQVKTKEKRSNTDNNITNKQEEQYIIGKPSSLQDVILYFEELKESNQAESFFDYFESNGWKVGGKAPMKNWKASARNWIRNSKKWGTNGTINSTTRKSDQTSRSTYGKSAEQIQTDVKNNTESIRLLRNQRS